MTAEDEIFDGSSSSTSMDSCDVKSGLVENHEEEFPTISGRAYLDHAGATLYSRSQLAAVQHDLNRHLYGNPHSRSPASRSATDAVDQARFRLLNHFHCNADQYSVVFTSGATAAIALLADAFQFGGGPDAPGSFVYLQESHTSVLGMRARLADRPVTVSALPAAAAAALLSPPAPPSPPAADTGDDARRGLFAFPALCNFSGRKYPLSWVEQCRRGALDGLTSGSRLRGGHHLAGCRWYSLLDAASFAATNDLDLSRYSPDFVCLSFYKMFGYPTGLGALLVHRRAQHTLHKRYFGGGTVQVSLAGDDFHVLRPALHDRLEDGTIPFLAIVAVSHGLDAVRRLAGSMETVGRHVFGLARYTYCHLSAMRHGNGSRVARIYADTAYDDVETQGGIVTFNLIRPDGEYFGSTEVEKFAEIYDLDLRTGCFCNPGACQRFLGHSTEMVKNHFEAGHVCGDEKDLIDGRPTGAVRCSFGYMSRRADADRLLLMVRQCFVCTAAADCDVSRRLQQAHSLRTSTRQTAEQERGRCGRTLEPSKDRLVPGGLPEQEATSRGTLERTESTCGGTLEQGVVAVKAPDQEMSNGRALEQEVSIGRTLEQSESSGGTLGQGMASEGTREQAESLGGGPLEQGVCDGRWTDQREAGGRLAAVPSGAGRFSGPGLEGAQSARLAQLAVFPVKSCAGFSVPWWPLGPRGLLYDRHWMVVAAGGWALTQKRQPELCRLRPELSLQTGTLILHADGFESIHVPLDPDPGLSQTSSSVCESRVCGDRVTGLDCGDEAADWLSQVLELDGVRLIRQSATSTRLTRVNGSSGALSLSNESQYVLVNRASVAALHSALEQRCGMENVTETELTGRFRANLVVAGLPPYEEDRMETVTVGDTTLRVLGGCSRCQMICVDQATGERSREPLLTLRATRGRRMPFGVHLGLPAGRAQSNALLMVGQPVTWIVSRLTAAEEQ